MAEGHRNKPLLLLIETPGAPACAMPSGALEGFEIMRATPADAEAVIERERPDLVLGPPGAVWASAPSPVSERELPLLQAIGEGVCIAGPDGAVLWSNRRFEGLDGTTVDRVGACCREAAAWFLATGGQGDAGTRGRRFTIAGDKDRFYELLVSPLSASDEGAEPDRVIAVISDVTSLQRTQRKIDAIDRAGGELVRLDAEAVRELNAAERLKLLEEKIVRFAHDLLRYDHFTIHLLDERSNRLELVMSQGLPESVKEIDLYSAREGSGTTGFVAATGRSYICYDASRDERYIQGLEQAGSSLTVPLRMHDKVIGVFNVESDRVGAFTEDDRQFLEIFARYVALAFHILDILVVERYTTNESVSGRVEGELDEPLQDLLSEAEWLSERAGEDPDAQRHAEQILRDVESIRRRMRDVASGPRSILGAEFVLSTAQPDPLLMGKRILVADDEPQVRETIRDVLERRGAEVRVCANGMEAVEMLERVAGADGERFRLVISDIKMPDRNGYEVFAAAKRLNNRLPVILMTGFGYDPHHSIVRASQEGLQCVLFKPFQAKQLLDEVHKAIEAEQDAGD